MNVVDKDKPEMFRNSSKSREAWRVNGVLRKRYVQCGEKTCRCYQGKKHGPYWYLSWFDSGGLKRRYIKPRELDVVRAALRRGHQWADRLKANKLKRLEALPLAKAVGNTLIAGEAVNLSFVEPSAKNMCEGLRATRLIRAGEWYVLWPDYRTQLVALKLVDRFCGLSV